MDFNIPTKFSVGGLDYRVEKVGSLRYGAEFGHYNGTTCTIHIAETAGGAALNEGWTPQFTGGEYRYYPCFELYNEEDWNDLPEDPKRVRGVLLGGGTTYGALAGFVYAALDRTPSITTARIGSHLCFKAMELALYAGKQFASLWLDFCCLPNTECKPYFNE